MDLREFGLTDEILSYLEENNLTDYLIGRVSTEHKERYVITDGNSDFDAEITGNMRFTARSRADFPAVGDWVIFRSFNTGQAVIYGILPRKTVLKRQATGRQGDEQVIAANIDVAMIVMSLDNNFNINRVERYLTICYDSGIEPLLVVTKTDLFSESDISEAQKLIEKREKNLKFFMLSNETLAGFDKLSSILEKGKTYSVIGSSGVGKSSLINNLLRSNILETGSISSSTGKGRHITVRRELFVLENGAVIIDNPGMKEVGMTDNKDGIAATFDDILKIGEKCKFPDCRHEKESGCAVLMALEKGEIDSDSYNNFLRLRREEEQYRMTVAEKRRKDKIFGKIVRNYNKNRDNL